MEMWIDWNVCRKGHALLVIRYEHYYIVTFVFEMQYCRSRFSFKRNKSLCIYSLSTPISKVSRRRRSNIKWNQKFLNTRYESYTEEEVRSQSIPVENIISMCAELSANSILAVFDVCTFVWLCVAQLFGILDRQRSTVIITACVGTFS